MRKMSLSERAETRGHIWVRERQRVQHPVRAHPPDYWSIPVRQDSQSTNTRGTYRGNSTASTNLYLLCRKAKT